MGKVKSSAPEPKKSAVEALPVLPGGRVLVVEDSNFIRVRLASMLKQLGLTVTVSENGRQALELLRAQSFDLVLLDILMPEMDGFEALEILKADKKLREVPVIVVSALEEIESAVRCIEMGAEDYLPKPFSPVLLRARIGASLEKKRLRNQELEYLQNVSLVIAAAQAVENGDFELERLNAVAARPDELGRLARVFQNMAREVYTREQRLTREVEELRIQIDETKRVRQVEEITDTEYFRNLQARAERLRKKRAA